MPRERGRRGYVSSGRLPGRFVRQSARAAGANWLGGRATRRATRTIDCDHNRARAVRPPRVVMWGRTEVWVEPGYRYRSARSRNLEERTNANCDEVFLGQTKDCQEYVFIHSQSDSGPHTRARKELGGRAGACCAEHDTRSERARSDLAGSRRAQVLYTCAPTVVGLARGGARRRVETQPPCQRGRERREQNTSTSTI